MKKILLLLMMVWGVSEAQVTGYTTINSGYKWLRGAFDAFNLPAGGTPSLATSQWVRAGALIYDSTGGNRGVHVWTGSAWVKLMDTTMAADVTGTPQQVAFYAPTTGLLTGSSEMQFREAADPVSNTSGMFRVGLEDGVAGGLGPEIILYSYGDDIGFVHNYHKNFYQGTSNGASVGFIYADAWNRSVQLYATSPYNAFGNSEATLRYTGKVMRFHVDTVAWAISWGGGSFNTAAVNEKMRLGPDYLNILSDSVRMPGVDVTVPIADSTGYYALLQNRATGAMARMNIASISAAITNGSGTTANGTAVDVGGALTSTPVIAGGGTYGTLFSGMGGGGFNITDAVFNNRLSITSSGSLYNMNTSGNRGGLFTRATLYPDSLSITLSSNKNMYIDALPHDASLTGKTVMWDSASKRLYAALAGVGGNVTKVGTPVDNQVGVWTGDGTIEGVSAFTFDGNQFLVRAASGNSDITTMYTGGTTIYLRHRVDGSGNIIMNSQGADFIARRNDANIWTYGASSFTIVAGVSLSVDGGTLQVAASTDRVGIGVAPTSKLEIIAGGVAANSAPLEFNSGPLETTIRSGLYEFNGSHYVSTITLNRVGVGGAIADFTTDVSNGTTVETDLYTYTTKASTLDTIGAKITAQYTVILTDATADKVVKLYFGGIEIETTGTLSAALGTITFDVSVIRTGASTARATIIPASTLFSSAPVETDLTGLTFTNTNIIKITGQASGATGGSGDITAKMGSVFFWPAANN